MVDIAKIVLFDVENFLRKVPKEVYIQKIPLLSSSSIGQHTRHLIEFFQCLAHQAGEECICYDKRQRNLHIETDPFYAADCVAEVGELLTMIPARKPLKLQVDYSLTGAESNLVESCFERELVYNIDHAIHHMAIIKIGLRAIAPDFVVPEGFGVNPSTLRYNKVKA
ncbi:MAG: hypothetical protein MRZ79_00900 [Bacteroidia bacterium]|nr:hypothetical protein [Bacteroidia bacterium]